MKVNTKRPAASSRIWPIARRRVASSVTSVSRPEIQLPPGGERFPAAKRRFGRMVPCGGHCFGSRKKDSRRGVTGQILFEPVDMIVAVDDAGLADQSPEQRQRGLD